MKFVSERVDKNMMFSFQEVDGIKPGPIFRDGSRVFMSAFEHLADVAALWRSGTLILLEYTFMAATISLFRALWFDSHKLSRPQSSKATVDVST